MATLQVIHDRELEFAVVINMDTGEAYSPVAAGAQAVFLLDAYVTAYGPVLDDLTPSQQLALFRAFIDGRTPFLSVTTPDTPPDKVEYRERLDLDANARLAEREASEHTDTPTAQPADTDEPASPPPEYVTVRCFNCNGEGVIHFGDGSPSATCNVCKGTGKVERVKT